MAGETNGAVALENTEHIPIAQLNPGLSAPATRAIKAVVTLTWPYSSATGSVAFLLSEPDFRLRRTRGQVRVRFSGSSAKAVAASGIASGDEVNLCLVGVEWVSDEDKVVTPGRGIEYELRFTERLLLQFKQEDTEEIKKIDLDHPSVELPATEAPVPAPPRVSTPEPEVLDIQTSTQSAARPAFGRRIGDEWPSPAFMKRARTSYGSLFEIDPFAEDDGSVPGKGRKRTRLSSNWIYASRSPSPDANQLEVGSRETSLEPAQKSAPTMADEGCQTVDLGSNAITEDIAQALADLSRQTTNVGGAEYPLANGVSSFGQQHSFATFVDNHANQAALPVIRTDEVTQQSDEHQSEPEISNSPRLQSIPSDSLSLVSPLLSTTSNIFLQQNNVQAEPRQPMCACVESPKSNRGVTGHAGGDEVEQAQIASSEAAVQSQVVGFAADLEVEDIYGASPAGHREQPESGLQSIQESMRAHDHAENPTFDSQFASENQYGHWQSAGAQISNVASPSGNEIFLEGTHGDGFYEVERVPQEDEDSLQTNVGMPHTAYPDMEGGLLGQVTSGWGASSVAYPEFSGSNDHAVPYTPRPLHSTAMSRSQSAQSAVVDLTESDDEADPAARLQQSGDEHEESLEAASDREDSVSLLQESLTDGRHGGDVRDGYFEEEEHGDHQAIGRQEEKYEDENEYSEADGDGEYDDEEQIYVRPHAAAGSDMDDEEHMEDFDQDEEGSYDEEEDEEEGESYDEEEDEDEDTGYDEHPESRARQQPEVIDLLSSDDEDEAPTRAPTSAVDCRKPSPPSRHANDSPMLDDDSGKESEFGDDENLPYAERAEIKTSLPGPERDHSSVSEEDDELEGEDEDAVYEDDLREDELRLDLVAPHHKLDAEIDPELEEQVSESEDEDEEEDEDEDGDEDGDEDENKDEGDSVFSEEPLSGLVKEKSDGGNEGTQDQVTEKSEVDEGSNSDGTERIGTSRDPEPPQLDVDTFAKPPATIANSHSAASPEGPSLFARVFSLDGANDEPRFGTSYRSMSREEAVLPSSNFLQKVVSEASTEHANAQLPTPEDTQISRKTVSLETSFSSVDGPQRDVAPPADEMDLDRTEETAVHQNQAGDGGEPSLVAAESSPMTDEQTSTLTMTATIELSEGIDDMGNFEAKSHAQQVPQLTEVVQTSDNTQHEESNEVGEMQDLVQEVVKVDSCENAVEEIIISTSNTAKAAIEDRQSVSSHEEMYSDDDAGDSRSQPTEHGNDATELSEVQVESPRRSTRRTHLTTKAAANAKENIRPVTPNKTATVTLSEKAVTIPAAKVDSRTKTAKENVRPVTPAKSRAPPSTTSDNEQSPLVVIDNQATPKGHDASLELALEESDSSSPPQHNLRKLPIADLKLRLTRALRTDLSEFTGLKVIRFHLTQKLDFLAVATTTPPEPQRAKNGPRQYQITFNITDPSIAPSSVTEVQVFRPYKDALPIVKAGDGILLRNFLVMSVQSRGGGPAFALRSTQEDASSWAVFKEDEEVEVRGPPVEYGEAEKNHVTQLRNWYASLDSVAQAKIARANGDKGIAGKAAGKKPSKAL